MNLESVRNYQELAVGDQIKVVAARYPVLSGNPDLVSDVACVALNSLKPRYIKHNVDMHFFERPRIGFATKLPYASRSTPPSSSCPAGRIGRLELADGIDEESLTPIIRD